MPTSRSLKPLAVTTLVIAVLGVVLIVVGHISQQPSFVSAGWTLDIVGFTGVGILGRCSAKFNRLNSGATSAPLDVDILFLSPSESWSAPSVGDSRQSTEIVDPETTVPGASPENAAVDPMSVSNPHVATMHLVTLDWPR